MKIKHILGLFVLLVLVIGLSGCKKAEPTTTAPTGPAKSVTPTAPIVQQPEQKEQLNNVKAVSEGFCGDGVCQNVEHSYPDSEVICNDQGCTVNGMYTENNFGCPGDCGTTCGIDTVIGVRPPVCQLLPDGNIKLNIVNSGKAGIDGFLFYVQSSDKKIGYDTSEKSLASKEAGEYTVNLASWKEKFGDIDSVQIMPRIVEDGQTKECANQKLIVTMTSCK